MKRISFIALLFASSSVISVAQDAPQPNDLFKQLDKNNDGKLVRDEIPEDQLRHFERLLRVGDEDKNGELSKAEFEKATSDKQDEPRRPDAGPQGGRPGAGLFDAKQMFERMDQNKDGKLSRNELPEFVRERLGKIFDDLKKDEISLDEFEKGREKLGPPPGGAGRPGFGNPEEGFKRMDANNDGKLTLDEVPEQARPFLGQLFERLGKKELTKDEFVQAAERMRAQAGEGGRRPEGTRPDGERRPEGGDRPRPEGERRPEGGGAPREGDRRPEGPGRGGDGAPRGPRFFQLLDADHNGLISRDELARAATLMETLDENKDGSLDMRELFGPPPGGAGGPEGMRGRGPEGAGPRDGDRRPEIVPGREGGRPEPGRRPEGDQPRRGEGDRPQRPEGDRPADGQRRPGGDQPREGAEGRRPQIDGEFFKRMDKDGDGKISKDEAPERLKENFGRADANGDGFVTLEELRRFMEQAGARRP